MRFKQNQMRILTFALIVVVFVAVYLFQSQPGRKTERVLPDVNQITSDTDLHSLDAKPNTEEPREEKIIIANLEDIAKASTIQFPVHHQVRDGSEWITSELEEYPVLYLRDPLLANLDVKGVQQILRDLNFYQGSIDGIYGPKTSLAVQCFQQYYGLEATGVMDLDDYDLLAAVYEETIPVAKKAKPTGNVRLLIILDERTLYVLENDQVFYRFPVAIGTLDTPSPLGNWKIVSKDSWGGGFGTRWLGLNVPYGRFGIHGTDKPWSIGGAESHGCLRMFNRDVELLFTWVTWGTQVHVVGGNFPYNLPWRIMDDGDRGSDIWILQNRLKELGYYKWRPDGVFGWATGSAVKKFQTANQLESTGQVDWATRQKLALDYFQ